MRLEKERYGHHRFSSIIGIGLNVNQTEFHSDAPNPASLRQITGIRYEREDALNSVIEPFTRLYLPLMEGGDESIRERYRAAVVMVDVFHLFRHNDVIV